MDTHDVTEIRDEIIMAALPHVAFDGWCTQAMIHAAADAGHKENVLRAVFPSFLSGNMSDVLDGFADLADREMLQILKEKNPDDLRVRDRVQTALMARYTWLSPHREALRQSLQFWMIPTRKPRAAKIVWRTADRIWDWAGDEARDYNRYTKRGLLSGVIIATTLAFLNDDSEDLDVTKAFLDRRIGNVMQLGKIVGKVKGRFSKPSQTGQHI